MKRCASSASLQPVAEGFRLVVVDRPRDETPRGTIVFAPPFAEEMNKTRRMAAQAARAFAADGWCVVRPDLHGCGDSSGDFGDAAWSDWIDDLRRCADVAQRAGGPLWLWGLRAGALLLPPLLAHVPRAHLLLWQPALSGAVVLNQFLRLKTAAGALGADRPKTGAAGLLQRLTQLGETIEIAGYRLSPRVAIGLAAARLDLPPAWRGRIVWLETGALDEPPTAPAKAERIERWRRDGVAVHAEFVAGAPFWQTVETSEVPLLVERSRAALVERVALAERVGAQPLDA